jgi:DNA (cytosine-5)-methyltransferase 1
MGGFRYIDLFAGVGGLRIPADELGGKCVFTSEIDVYARETYAMNFQCGLDEIHGDITTLDLNQIPDHDLLLAGFPCQPFSNAGKRKGFNDLRGTLFFYIASVIHLRKPKAVLLENVRGLLTHDRGNTFRVIVTALEDLGYVVASKVLNARDFGLPQNRNRLFIVAIREDLFSEKLTVFPQPTHDRNSLRVGDILDANPDAKLTISAKLWEGHQNRKARNMASGKGFGYQLFSASSQYTATLSARYYKDGSEILITQEGNNPRMLSPIEAARLQGFPRDFLMHPNKKNAYKQMGNAVPVNVVRAIVANLRNVLI